MINTVMKEHELVEAARSGDRLAYEQLVNQYLPYVHSLALNITRNKMDADDVTQEVFIRAYQSIKSFRGESKLRTWLYRITINQALQYKKRTRKHTGDSLRETETIPDGKADAMHTLMQENQHQILTRSIARLPEKQRLVVQLRLEHDLKFKEIAVVMKRTVGAVKANYFHAIKKLQIYLNPEDVI